MSTFRTLFAIISLVLFLPAPIVAQSRATMAPPEPFSLAECLVTGKGTHMDYRNPLGSYGRQDTSAWRRQECESAQRMYEAQLLAYEQWLKRQQR